MKTYTRDETIQEGKKRVIAIKVFAFSIAAFLLGGGICCYVGYFLSGQVEVGQLAGGIVFSLFAAIVLLVSLLHKSDHLMEGVRHYYNQIFDEVSKRNRKYGVSHQPKFKVEELYSLLKENESVSYYDSNEVIVVSKKTRSSIRYRGSGSSTEQDPFDEVEEFYSGKKEFDELSEDAKNIYYDDEFYDD